MSRADLQHLSEGQVLTGVELSRAEAAALSGTKLLTATPYEDGWKVEAGQWVGAVRCGDLDVRVAPKVGAVKVLELLARAQGVRGLRIDDQQIGLVDDANLSAVLAVLFEREARKALAHRPQRGYRTEEQSLPVVRGRIRLVDQALRRYGSITPIEVTFDEWTLDTDDNRLVRAAAQLLLVQPGIPPTTKAGLRRVDRMLADVQLPPPGTQLAPWRATRLNIHVHQLLHLADLALAGASVEYRVGSVLAHGFALNMGWVFETLVARLLTEQCARSGSPRLLAQQSFQLDYADHLTIRPDLIISEGPNTPAVAVADTKYKLLDGEGAFPNADAYQLVTYCMRLGLTVGHLIYAGDVLAAHDRHVIRGARVTILVHSINLRSDLADIESQILELHERLVEPFTFEDALPLSLTTASRPGR